MRISDWSSDVCSSDLPCAMRQVPARIQRHAEEGVAGLEQRQHHRAIGLRARMGLHIGEGAVEKLPCAPDRKAFHLVRRTRKSVAEGQSWVGRVDLGGCRIIKKKKKVLSHVRDS